MRILVENNQNYFRCMTENERYGGKDYVEKTSKGEGKQRAWIQMITEGSRSKTICTLSSKMKFCQEKAIFKTFRACKKLWKRRPCPPRRPKSGISWKVAALKIFHEKRQNLQISFKTQCALVTRRQLKRFGASSKSRSISNERRSKLRQRG